MTAEELTTEISRMFSDYLGKAEPLDPSLDLVDDVELESVQVMEVIVEIEDHYDIAIDLEGLSNVRTINELAALVHKITS